MKEVLEIMQTKKTDLFFDTTSDWKPIKIWVCQSRMQLWVALQLISIYVQDRKETKEELKEAILSFPESTNGCRCKNCRYFRMVTKRD